MAAAPSISEAVLFATVARRQERAHSGGSGGALAPAAGARRKVREGGAAAAAAAAAAAVERELEAELAHIDEAHWLLGRLARVLELGDSELKIMGIECSAKFMRKFIAGLLSVLAFAFFEVWATAAGEYLIHHHTPPRK